MYVTLAVVWPSRMVMVVPEKVPSPAVMPVPDTPMSTVWLPATARLAVTVAVTTVPAASVPAATSTDRATVTGSSVTVTVDVTPGAAVLSLSPVFRPLSTSSLIVTNRVFAVVGVALVLL